MLDIHDTIRRNNARQDGFHDAVAGDPRCTYFTTPEEMREYNTGWKKGQATLHPEDGIPFMVALGLYGLAMAALVVAFAVWY